MKILDKLELLKAREDDFIKDSNEYETALKTYSEMIENGIMKPRGYCLSSIADYTNIVFSNKDFSNKNWFNKSRRLTSAFIIEFLTIST